MKKEKFASNRIILLVICFMLFLLYGAFFTLFSTNTTAMMAFFGVSEAKLGTVMTLQAIGSLVITILLGLFGERINKITGLFIGILLMGIASVLIGVIPKFSESDGMFMLLLIFSLLGGIGYIFLDLLNNSVVTEVFQERKQDVLPYIHAAYSTGAMLVPLLANAMVSEAKPSSYAAPYLLLGILSLALFIFFAIVKKFITKNTVYEDVATLKSHTKQNPAEIFKDPKAWLFTLMTLCFMCLHCGIISWLPRFFKVERGMDLSQSNLTITLYFLGILVIRLITSAIYKKISIQKFHYLSMVAFTIVFLIIIIFKTPFILTCILIFIAGACCGAVLPGFILLSSDAFPERSASASSTIIIGIVIGSLILPVGLGALIEGIGYLAAIAIFSVGPLLSAVVLFIIEKMKKKA